MPGCCFCEGESKITKSVDIKKMEENFDVLAISGENWETLYKCKYCKTFWEERYTGGRWDGWPELHKVSTNFVVAKWGREYVE